MTDAALEERLYGPTITGRVARPLPDPTWMHTERRRAGVTLELLHLEYLEQHPDGYRYSAFCAHYRAGSTGQRLPCARCPKPARCSVDYSGKRPEIVEAATGIVRPAEFFVAVLGASNYTYAEATETQRSCRFHPESQPRGGVLGGVPALIVPDQLKTGVRDASRYEPILQRTYEEWAAHYQTAILPARPAKPRDKAKGDVAVQVAQRWILARLRHETFCSLAALNARIRELLVDLNARPMKGYGGLSRRDLLERLEQDQSCRTTRRAAAPRHQCRRGDRPLRRGRTGLIFVTSNRGRTNGSRPWPIRFARRERDRSLPPATPTIS